MTRAAAFTLRPAEVRPCSNKQPRRLSIPSRSARPVTIEQDRSFAAKVRVKVAVQVSEIIAGMNPPLMQPTTCHRGRFARGPYLFLVLFPFSLLLSGRANAQATLSPRGPCVAGRVTATKEFPIKRVRIVVGVDLPEAGEAVASPGGLFTLCFPESTRPGDLVPLKIFSLENNVRRRLAIAGIAPGENGKVAVPGPRKRIKIRVTSVGREEQIAEAAREIRDGSSEPGRILERLAVSLDTTNDDLAAEINAWSRAQADPFDHNCLPLALDQESARYRECLDKIAPGIDSNTANRDVTLAWMQYSNGLYQEAENTLDPAKSLQPENPAILDALGATERAQKKYKEADASYQDAVRLSLATHPAMNLELAASLSNFGELKGITGGCLDAELFQDWTLTIERKELGPAHQELAIALGRLSTLYAATGRYDEADKLAKRALELWPKDKKGEPRYVRAARLACSRTAPTSPESGASRMPRTPIAGRWR